jgi:RNA polymerase-binding transcription factor
LQAKLVELIETVSIRQPDKLEQASFAGCVQVRSLDLSRHHFNLMQQILKALERIDAGTYGICKRCQRQIETSLLSTTPWAALCSDCGQPSKSSAAR